MKKMESSGVDVVADYPDCPSCLTLSRNIGDCCSLCERLQGNRPLSLSLSDGNNDNNTRINDDDDDSSVNNKCIKRQGSMDRSMRTQNEDSRGPSSVVRWQYSRNCHHTHFFNLIGFIIVVALVVLVNGTNADFHKLPIVERSVNSSRDGVCQSIDIRNRVDQFSKLRGCRVVEGFVQILLIDHANETAYINQSFPELVEITGYLVLYRVSGLKSIGRLFPNLRVIRGHSLFINYALVAFEMMHLQEIGLHSLTDILRGSVRFDKNPVLCYADTIDWDLIAKAGKGEHSISGNKPQNGCPVCDKKCPMRSMTHLKRYEERLCWNQEHCQLVCDPVCGTSSCLAKNTSSCCHESCLGSCEGTSAGHCLVCKDVSVDNMCVNKCPDNTYEFMNRRCVQEGECRRMRKPREALNTVKEYPYKPFNGSCIMECPAGYMEEEIDGKASCKKCKGICLKECSGINVESIATAQKLRGCTHIRGSLEIQIRGGKNIVKELEDNLNMIEVIDGYLKIVRSFPLISLNFLKSLRVIKGESLENNKYSLAVLDNQNLQELWDWSTHPNITIGAEGTEPKLFFHFNPKLCLQKIEELRIKAGLQPFTDLEVAPNSNGDKVACNVSKLHVRIHKRTAEAVLVGWEPFEHHDSRSLLGYVVYSIEAPEQNIAMYDGRDACGGDRWHVDDVASNEQKNDGNETRLQNHILTLLKPYTQYAFYVKTYTIATERSGAQSDLMYVTTMPGTPTPPRALTMWSNGSSELVIQWQPPMRANGELTHYNVYGRMEPDDAEFLQQRNYCNEPIHLPEKKSIATMAAEERERAEVERQLAKQPENPTCQCSGDKNFNEEDDREKEVSSSIAFEDALHNQVYIKRTINHRRKRHIDLSIPTDFETLYQQIFGDADKNEQCNDDDTCLAFKNKRETLDSQDNIEKELTDETIGNNTYMSFVKRVMVQNNSKDELPSITITGLRHFAAYNIEVQACRQRADGGKDLDLNPECSTKTMRTYHTLPLDGADDIPAGTFKLEMTGNSSQPVVQLQWAEPPEPNGIIVTYQIEYKRVDIQNIQAIPICITRTDFLRANKYYYLRGMTSGNYSIKVRATSLAGPGAYSEVKYFIIDASTTSSYVWIILGVFTSIILFSIVAFAFFCRRKIMGNVPNMRLIASVNPEYVSPTYVPDEWEVPREQIEVVRELGNGSFGMVYEGIIKDADKEDAEELRVAVKTVRKKASDHARAEFLHEATVMKAFHTNHVVKLLGVVSCSQPTLVIMELMRNGDLKSYLRSHRPDNKDPKNQPTTEPPTLKRLMRMAVEIADGMAYLTSKKFVHRDLAARNVMIAEDMTVKIGDFGMTRDIYETDYYRKGTRGFLPVRWMAPESLKDGVFTNSSDVWSYGVVLWEMVTLASQPYPGLGNDMVLKYVISGGLMECPDNCPNSLYLLMRKTWHQKAHRRPTFIDITTILLNNIHYEDFSQVSFYHSPGGIESRYLNVQHSTVKAKDLEISFDDLWEDYVEEEEQTENSPLRRDFGDFACIEPGRMPDCTDSHNGSEPCGESSKLVTNFHDLNSSEAPPETVPNDSNGRSLNSSRDTLDCPFADSLRSSRNSPSIRHNNVSTTPHISPASASNSIPLTKRNNTSKGNCANNSSLSKKTHDYENHTPEGVATIENKDTVSIRITSPSVEDIEVDVINGDDRGEPSTVDHNNGTETLNGYIGNTAT